MKPGRRSLHAALLALAPLAACNVYDPSLLDAGPADGGGGEACATTCGGKCVDVTTDKSNCGACGKTCANGCVAGLCEADVLVDSRNAPHAIVLDQSQIFFGESSSVQVSVIDKDGKNLQVVTGQAVYPEGLAIDTAFVYWTNLSNLVGVVGQAPKIGGNSVILGKSLPLPSSLAFDGSGMLYVATGTPNKAPNCLPTSYASSVLRCPTTGCYVANGCPTSGGPEVVLTETAVPSGITVAGGALYLTSRTGKWLKTCTLPACGNLTAFSVTLAGPTDVVATTDAVFVADTDGGTIVRCDRITKACATIADSIDQPWRIAVQGNDLYFTAYAKAVKGAAGLYRCALPDCKGGAVKLTAGTSFYGVAADTQYVYFTEEGSTAASSTDGRIRRLAR